MMASVLNEKFAFKMKDLPWSLEQLSLMGLYALEHLIEKGLGELPGNLKRSCASASLRGWLGRAFWRENPIRRRTRVMLEGW